MALRNKPAKFECEIFVQEAYRASVDRDRQRESRGYSPIERHLKSSRFDLRERPERPSGPQPPVKREPKDKRFGDLLRGSLQDKMPKDEPHLKPLMNQRKKKREQFSNQIASTIYWQAGIFLAYSWL